MPAKTTDKAFYDISSWDTQDRAELAALADQDSHTAALIKDVEATRAGVRERIRELLERYHVPAGERLAVGNYEVSETDQTGPRRANLEILEKLYPEVFATVVEAGKPMKVLRVRPLAGE